jgi:uncharacterized membrane protein YagU involved in acid resistance
MEAVSLIGVLLETAVRALAEWLRVNRSVAKLVLVVRLLLSALGAVFIWFPPPEWKQSEGLELMGFIALIAGLFSALVSAVALSPIPLGSRTDLELRPIREERDEIQERIENKPKPDVKDSILLNLNQLTEYYTINKAQARSSFRASVFAIVVGLLTIVGGIWIFYFGRSRNVELAAISAIGGVLIEFIGGAYFLLYNKTTAQSNYLYDRLVGTQDTMLAVSLCAAIDDLSLRNDTTRQIILALMGRGSPPAGGYEPSTAASSQSASPISNSSSAESTGSRAQTPAGRMG